MCGVRWCVLFTVVLCFVFFFSSRRRHTRYWRDWSSDVCSSDLRASLLALVSVTPVTPQAASAAPTGASGGGVRSEERRVGKECRARWSPYQYKKKNRATLQAHGEGETTDTTGNL